MDERSLIDKLRRIEALHSGAATEGERDAALHARERILQRLRQIESEGPGIVFKFSLADPWSRKLFLALARRYELKPYRERGQRHTTVMIRAPRRFVDETLWPEFRELDDTLRSFLNEVTDRVIRDEIHGDRSDAEEQGGALENRATTAA